ncbi:radical SAM domain protein [Desulfitobacterium hafniense DP7]|uniref:Radical SAM domain protein n=2 Tax=Desulfitobacterium hafniense TaxID=49338 RepID=G9XVX1_DESHA|nr:radical SAM domain protein [Desulfitobacterium hafniense DP7]
MNMRNQNLKTVVKKCLKRIKLLVNRFNSTSSNESSSSQPPAPKPIPYIVTGDPTDIQLLFEFSERYEKLYIFGTDETAQYLLKFFDECGVRIDALITRLPSEINLSKKNVGVIVACYEHNAYNAVNSLKKTGCKNIYRPSDLTLWATANKMRPRPRERMWIEINLADHCNLNCQFCDHYSQLSKPYCLDISTYERDIKRLAELSNGHIGILKLQGGEPLLNPDIAKFVRITRKYFPKTKIKLFSNGILLKKSETFEGGNLLQAMKDCDVSLRLTIYPLTIDIAEVVKTAQQYGIQVEEITNYLQGAVKADSDSLSKLEAKVSVKHPFDLDGGANKYEWINCYQLNESIVLRDGKLYTCPQTAYIHIFNEKFGTNLELSDDDYIDIFEAKNYSELSEFCAKRTSFCRYCAVHKRSPHQWKTSTRRIDEYIL